MRHGKSRRLKDWCQSSLTERQNTFIVPIMLSNIGYGAFLFYGCMNVVATPMIYYFYPEVAGKSLEEVNLLFTSDSLLVSKNMEEYHRRIAAAGGSVAVAARQLLDEVDGTTYLEPGRRMSVGKGQEEKAVGTMWSENGSSEKL